MVRFFCSIVFLCVICSNRFYAQNQDFESFIGEPVEIQMNVGLMNPFFLIYKDITKGKDFILKSASDTIMQNLPESILISWYLTKSDKLFYPANSSRADYGIKSNFNSESAQDYLVLKQKLTFDYNNSRIALIKFSDYRDSTLLQTRVFSFILVQGKWYLNSSEKFKKYEEAILQINGNVFYQLMGRTEVDNTDIMDTRKIVQDSEKALNLDALYQYLNSLNKNSSRYKSLCVD